jgi:hypothetical protein
MAKYNSNNVKKIKQASKDYGTERRSNIEENINQMSSDSSKDSNTRYDKTTDPTSPQHKSSENSDLSRDNNLGRTELKQLEASTINSPNEQSEEIKPLVVYDIAAKDGVTEADTKKSVSILPYDDKDKSISSRHILMAKPYERLVSSMECIPYNNNRRSWFFPT